MRTQDFATFFDEIYGHEPFLWQLELLDLVIRTGRWPERISAPTGSGKTSVIDVHAFANALAHQDGLRLPRRLVMTVNRRSLIDDHAEHAGSLASALRKAQEATDGAAGPVTSRVAELLLARSGRAVGLAATEALKVHTVRGGIPRDGGWTAEPLACAVICMTPDMWGSRILFRGYGTSRRMRPMEAGLLGRDSVLVVDEAHLNRQLLLTARRVAHLDQASGSELGSPPLQVVETTATPGVRTEQDHEISVDPKALGGGPPGELLRRRLATPKPVEVKAVSKTRDDEGALVGLFVQECHRLAAEPRFARAPIGCIVNTVALARGIAAALRAVTDDPASVIEIVGGLRPHDRAHLTKLHPSLRGGHSGATKWPENAVRFVVGTQALEVGLDIDLAALVTELAPAAAVVQRAGRVNRYGDSEDGLVIVIAPTYDPKAPRVPYELEDMEAAREWLTSRAKTAEGLAPLALYADRPPAASARRVLFQRLEWYDAVRLARTSEETVFSDNPLPGVSEDLTLWLRDDLNDQVEAFVVVRAFLPLDAEHAKRVADATRPMDAELFSISLQRLRMLASEEGAQRSGEKLLVYRRGKAEILNEARELWPGDVLVVPPGFEVLPTPKNTRNAQGGPDDVYDVVAEGAQTDVDDPFVQVRLLLPAAASDAELSHEDGAEGASNGSTLSSARAAALALAFEPADLESEESDKEALRSEAIGALADYVLAAGADASAKAAGAPPSQTGAGEELGERKGDGARAAGLLRRIEQDVAARISGVEIIVVPGLGPLDQVFVMLRNRPLESPEEKSEFSRSNVFLEDHVAAVTERAQALASGLGLPTKLAETVVAAAHHHDDGKAHPRFQSYLASRWPQPRLLAKSKYRISRRTRSELGLVGWRHEQLSAASANAVQQKNSALLDLTTWLVGTSHGNGRGAFDADSSSLLLDSSHGFGEKVVTAASDLFDNGGWETLFESLLRKYGPWGLAYLEAVLRAADQTISGEGR